MMSPALPPTLVPTGPGPAPVGPTTPASTSALNGAPPAAAYAPAASGKAGAGSRLPWLLAVGALVVAASFAVRRRSRFRPH